MLILFFYYFSFLIGLHICYNRLHINAIFCLLEPATCSAFILYLTCIFTMYNYLCDMFVKLNNNNNNTNNS